jgi:hypothetical protein
MKKVLVFGTVVISATETMLLKTGRKCSVILTYLDVIDADVLRRMKWEKQQLKLVCRISHGWMLRASQTEHVFVLCVLFTFAGGS